MKQPLITLTLPQCQTTCHHLTLPQCQTTCHHLTLPQCETTSRHSHSTSVLNNLSSLSLYLSVKQPVITLLYLSVKQPLITLTLPQSQTTCHHLTVHQSKPVTYCALNKESKNFYIPGRVGGEEGDIPGLEELEVRKVTYQAWQSWT